MDLDDRLATAAPPLVARTDELHDTLNNLVTATERKSRPRKAPRIIVVAITVLAVLFGGGSVVAVAQRLLAPPVAITCPEGQSAVFEVEFKTHNDLGGEPMSRDWPYEIQVETRDAANAYAANYDWGAVDREAATKAFRAEEKRIIEDQDPGERQPRASDENAEMLGVEDVFFDDLRAYLASKDLPMESITSVTGYTNCDQEEK